MGKKEGKDASPKAEKKTDQGGEKKGTATEKTEDKKEGKDASPKAEKSLAEEGSDGAPAFDPVKDGYERCHLKTSFDVEPLFYTQGSDITQAKCAAECDSWNKEKKKCALGVADDDGKYCMGCAYKEKNKQTYYVAEPGHLHCDLRGTPVTQDE